MLKKLIAYSGAFLAVQPSLHAACALDGHTTNTIAQGNFASAPTQTITLTTTSPNDVIIFYSSGNVRAIDAMSVASISGAGTTAWQNRFKETQALPDCRGVGSPCYFDVEMWWARAVSPLSSATFTVTYNAPAQAAFVNLYAYGMSGLANPASPWDVNGSLPRKATNYLDNPATPTAMQVSGVSTTNADDILLFSCFGNIATGGVSNSNCNWGPVSPWLSIDRVYQQNIFSAFFNNSSQNYQEVAAPLSGATLSDQNPAVAINTNWIMSVDALVCVASAPPAPSAIPHIWVHE